MAASSVNCDQGMMKCLYKTAVETCIDPIIKQLIHLAGCLQFHSSHHPFQPSSLNLHSHNEQFIWRDSGTLQWSVWTLSYSCRGPVMHTSWGRGSFSLGITQPKPMHAATLEYILMCTNQQAGQEILSMPYLVKRTANRKKTHRETGMRTFEFFILEK